MTITCPHCKKNYTVPEERLHRLAQQGAIACPACRGSIPVSSANRPAAAAVPESAAAQPPPAAGGLKERLAQTLKQLPPMPPAAAQVRRVMAAPQARATDLANAIEADQAIAQRVLRLAGNMPSMQQAASFLGMRRLHEFFLLACASGLLGGELNGYGLRAGDLWRHSLAVAGCARSLANDKASALADDAFEAGLFHDCGKLILNASVAERREAFFEYMQDVRKSFLDAERRVLGFEHPQVAADLCVRWQLPRRQTVAIALHHTPSRMQHNDLAHILHAADAIAMMSGIGSGIDGMRYSIDEATVEYLNLENSDIGILMVESAEYVKSVMAGS